MCEGKKCYKDGRTITLKPKSEWGVVGKGELKIIKCVVTDAKAHTYNSCTELMYENIESGLIQTGIPYPNASGGHQYDPDHIDGLVIEFCGQEIDFNIYDYEMEGIVVYEKNN